MDLSFSVQKLEKVSSNPGKVHFEGLVHLLSYIDYIKTLGLNYYDGINDAPLTDILRQASINTENQLTSLFDSSCQYFPDTGISIGVYIIFYQGGPI